MTGSRVLFALALLFLTLAVCRVLRPIERTALADYEVAARAIAVAHGHPELSPRFIDWPGTAVQTGVFLVVAGLLGYLGLKQLRP